MQELMLDADYLSCLETESIADYLLKHRVLTEVQFIDLNKQKLRKDKNVKLLEYLQINSEDEDLKEMNISGLFVNALRSAGCHTLASTIDVDERLISPVSRRRGQISLVLQVSALQIKVKELLDKQVYMNNVDSSMFDDSKSSIWLQSKQLEVNCSGDTEAKIKSKPKRISFLRLFCCGLRKNKSAEVPADSMNMEEMEREKHNKKQHKVNSQIDDIRRLKIDILTEKSVMLYKYLSNGDSAEWTAIVKYFEQTHKVLVFDRDFDDTAMIITLICTKKDTLSSLQAQLQRGVLEEELGRLMLTKSVLDSLGVRNLRLGVSVRPEELRVAAQELVAFRNSRQIASG